MTITYIPKVRARQRMVKLISAWRGELSRETALGGISDLLRKGARPQVQAARLLAVAHWQRHKQRFAVRVTKKWVHIGKEKIYVPKGTHRRFTYPLKVVLTHWLWDRIGEYNYAVADKQAQAVAELWRKQRA